MDYDRFSTGKSVIALDSTNITTATDTLGEIIDTQFYGSIVVAVNVTDVTAGEISAITFEEGDDAALADAADISSSILLTYPTQYPVDAAGVVRVGCVSKKRYVRLKVTTTTATTVDITATALAELNCGQAQPGEVTSSKLATADINCPDDTGDAIVTSPKRTT